VSVPGRAAIAPRRRKDDQVIDHPSDTSCGGRAPAAANRGDRPILRAESAAAAVSRKSNTVIRPAPRRLATVRHGGRQPPPQAAGTRPRPAKSAPAIRIWYATARSGQRSQRPLAIRRQRASLGTRYNPRSIYSSGGSRSGSTW
jgi:hypothetical protein